MSVIEKLRNCATEIVSCFGDKLIINDMFALSNIFLGEIYVFHKNEKSYTSEEVHEFRKQVKEMFNLILELFLDNYIKIIQHKDFTYGQSQKYNLLYYLKHMLFTKREYYKKENISRTVNMIFGIILSPVYPMETMNYNGLTLQLECEPGFDWFTLVDEDSYISLLKIIVKRNRHPKDIYMRGPDIKFVDFEKSMYETYKRLFERTDEPKPDPIKIDTICKIITDNIRFFKVSHILPIILEKMQTSFNKIFPDLTFMGNCMSIDELKCFCNAINSVLKNKDYPAHEKDKIKKNIQKMLQCRVFEKKQYIVMQDKFSFLREITKTNFEIAAFYGCEKLCEFMLENKYVPEKSIYAYLIPNANHYLYGGDIIKIIKMISVVCRPTLEIIKYLTIFTNSFINEITDFGYEIDKDYLAFCCVHTDVGVAILREKFKHIDGHLQIINFYRKTGKKTLERYCYSSSSSYYTDPARFIKEKVPACIDIDDNFYNFVILRQNVSLIPFLKYCGCTDNNYVVIYKIMGTEIARILLRKILSE